MLSLILVFYGLNLFLQARKAFAQKVKAMKRLKYLPVKTLQEICFKTIVLSPTYCILIWGNCSTALFSPLDSIHSKAARIILNLDLSISDAKCLLNSHWPSFSHFYKKVWPCIHAQGLF